MKKNKHLDKIVDQTLRSVIQGDKLDQTKVQSAVNKFKKMTLTDSIYTLNSFKKGLTDFIDKHTLTIYAPVELTKETLTKITQSPNFKFQTSLEHGREITNHKFVLDSSLLAGFKFKIGDTIFDSSLRSSLKALAK